MDPHPWQNFQRNRVHHGPGGSIKVNIIWIQYSNSDKSLHIKCFSGHCRYLQNLPIWGREGLFSKCCVTNMYDRFKRSQLFETLPANLSRYECWLPDFKFMDGPVNAVHVVFRAKLDATAEDLYKERHRESCSAREWWISILIPAVHSLLDDTKTRLSTLPPHFQHTCAHTQMMYLYWTGPLTMQHSSPPSINTSCGILSVPSMAKDMSYQREIPWVQRPLG